MPRMTAEPVQPTQPTLEEMVKAYVGEYITTDIENVKQAEEKLNSLLSLAVNKAEWLLINADKESVQWSVAKYIIDHALGNGSGDDEIKELLERIAKRPSVS